MRKKFLILRNATITTTWNYSRYAQQNLKLHVIERVQVRDNKCVCSDSCLPNTYYITYKGNFSQAIS